MSRRIRILDAVSHERLDDEVIAINLETGAYFAFDGPAAECWTTAHAGGDLDAIVNILTARFDVSADTAAADAAAFLTALVEHGLASEIGDAETSPVTLPPVTLPPVTLPPVTARPAGRLPYIPPVVEGYDDLETLLLIDPIHEVDEAGWPLPAPDDT